MVYEISMPLSYLFGYLILIILSDLVLQDINNNENSARHCSSMLTMSSSQQHSEIGTIVTSFESNLSETTRLKMCSQDLNLGFTNPETSHIMSSMFEIVQKE